jgi:hypothetical protein
MQDYLHAAQRAVGHLNASPFQRTCDEGVDKCLPDPELCGDVIEQNLCAAQVMLYGIMDQLRGGPR